MNWNLFTMLVLQLLSSPENLERRGGWELVWSENFDNSGVLDSDRWTYETGYRRNNEIQIYSSSTNNVRAEGGLCIIECRLESDSIITSGSIITDRKENLLYGRVEVRAQIPSAKGSWPAIWMMGANHKENPWPECGEIDIMEHVGYKPRFIHANVHMKDFQYTKGVKKGARIRVKKPWEGFHIYALEWYEDRLDFYFNDSLYYTYLNDMTGNNDTWPYDKPHFLIMNVAYGGTWGGKRGVKLKALPLQMNVDYVRYYREPGPEPIYLPRILRHWL